MLQVWRHTASFVSNSLCLKFTYHFYCWFQGNKTRYHLHINDHHIGDRMASCVTIVSKGKGVRALYVKESQSPSFKNYHKPACFMKFSVTSRNLCSSDMYDTDVWNPECTWDLQLTKIIDVQAPVPNYQVRIFGNGVWQSALNTW